VNFGQEKRKEQIIRSISKTITSLGLRYKNRKCLLIFTIQLARKSKKFGSQHFHANFDAFHVKQDQGFYQDLSITQLPILDSRKLLIQRQDIAIYIYTYCPASRSRNV